MAPAITRNVSSVSTCCSLLISWRTMTATERKNVSWNMFEKPPVMAPDSVTETALYINDANMVHRKIANGQPQTIGFQTSFPLHSR